MIHDLTFGSPDWILVTFAPPMVGFAFGLLVGLRRHRFGLAGFGGDFGGTLGARLGVFAYGGRDSNIFLRHGDVRDFRARVQLVDCRASQYLRKGLSGPGCLAIFVCGGASLGGVFLCAIANEPSAFIPIDESIKYIGIAAILGGAVAIAVILCWIRRQATGPMNTTDG